MKELFTALSKFQSEVKNPDKSSKGVHGANYAPIEVVWDVARELLGKYGLGLSHFPVSQIIDGKLFMGLRTHLFHSSGESIVSEFVIPVLDSNPQKLGGFFTYFRRYVALSVLGITPENEDLDADNIDTQAVKKAHEIINKEPTKTRPPAGTIIENPFPFKGKYKDVPLKEVPTDFIKSSMEWCLKENKFHDWVRQFEVELKNREKKNNKITAETLHF